MKWILPALAACFAVFAIPACAQPAPPPAGAQTPVVTYCWNGAALVACGVAPLTYSGAPTASVTTGSTTIASSGTYTRALTITTLPASTTNVWLNVSCGAAVVGSGILLSGGGGGFSFGGPAAPIPTCPITAITDGVVPQTVALAGG
jgi:hypothetical protein